MLTETGIERRSDGPRRALSVPAAAADGSGACRCDSIATPIDIAPPSSSSTPMNPKNRARPVPGGEGGGGAE